MSLNWEHVGPVKVLGETWTMSFPPLESVRQHSKFKSTSCWPRLIPFRVEYQKRTMQAPKGREMGLQNQKSISPLWKDLLGMFISVLWWCPGGDFGDRGVGGLMERFGYTRGDCKNGGLSWQKRQTQPHPCGLSIHRADNSILLREVCKGW